MTNTRFKSALYTLAAGIAAASLAGVADAQPAAQDPPKLVLHYSAASLQSERGVQALLNRLELAAVRVCPQPTSRLMVGEAIMACRKNALAGAVAQVHNERLVALSAGRSNQG
jgi:UrcA family protein